MCASLGISFFFFLEEGYITPRHPALFRVSHRRRKKLRATAATIQHTSNELYVLVVEQRE